ncbi:hypothetical protein [Aequorivita capsosiphonis]|uniref:hypothetical protein n=1 Tax=Aequorivita capsosiphonis TaxID=487317 RepID=UPI0004299911|nr:hypothetical protein [Aequorivita capsosiphonis]
MTKLKLFIPILLLFSIILTSCSKDDDNEIKINDTSIIPSTNLDRPNTFLGCIEIEGRISTIEAWDHGQIDGDIVSIIANGDVIVDEKVLDGPSNKISVDYDFGYNGYNYVTLYAHNLGSISPNTCTITINGTEYVLEANLQANGSIDVIVGGYGVTCDAGN